MTCPAPFQIKTLCKSSAGRTGSLTLGRGTIKTPVFMPVGTQAAIRTMPPHHLRTEGAQIVLANTYHLHQRPGELLIDKLGGLHRFMGVDLPILTDSGGFQVFSLRKKQISEEGVRFSYAVDGKETFLSPETSMAIQQMLGSDIAMAFDECLPPEADRATVAASVDMTARWAERCIKAHDKPDQSLFGIVQGGMFPELRKRSVHQITALPFDGFAIGGLSVGEGPDKMNAMLGETMPHMPVGSARYLMGVGRPQDLVDGVATGIDMFDCVIPTRHARGGVLYTFQGRIRISHSRYRRDGYPADTACGCYTCLNFSRAYLHHLFDIGEVLGATLATIHNLRFFADLMSKVRDAIDEGTFGQLRKDIKALYPEKDGQGTPRDDDEAAPQIHVGDVDDAAAARQRFAEEAKSGSGGVRQTASQAASRGRSTTARPALMPARTTGAAPRPAHTSRPPVASAGPGPVGGVRGGQAPRNESQKRSEGRGAGKGGPANASHVKGARANAPAGKKPKRR